MNTITCIILWAPIALFDGFWLTPGPSTEPSSALIESPVQTNEANAEPQPAIDLDPALNEADSSTTGTDESLPAKSDQQNVDSTTPVESDQPAVAESDLIAAELDPPVKIKTDPETELPSWRERYTLGPGDAVNIRFYGQDGLDRPGVRIAPDGTLSYLQVNSLQVSEMTIDEMRAALENSLINYYRNPRLIITPWELKSKRYVILGKVVDKGVFTLDRPITLLEAIARSRGIETGLFEQSTVEIADMDRSFVVRHGKRLDVDFSKLYFEGDLSQNMYLEPQDYIFLASNLSNEYYVLGAVAQPGAQGFSNRASIISAVTRREGFTEGSWKKRVLVVRGSLSNPKLFVVDVDAILKGHSPDFLLEPGDIVYVNNRPWYKAEQILDTAIQNFMKSATSTWVIENVPDAIQDPWFNRTGWRDAQ